MTNDRASLSAGTHRNRPVAGSRLAPAGTGTATPARKTPAIEYVTWSFGSEASTWNSSTDPSATCCGPTAAGNVGAAFTVLTTGATLSGARVKLAVAGAATTLRTDRVRSTGWTAAAVTTNTSGAIPPTSRSVPPSLMRVSPRPASAPTANVYANSSYRPAWPAVAAATST